MELEQLPSKQRCVGSNPTSGAIFSLLGVIGSILGS